MNPRPSKGALAWMVEHPVAANLAMFLLLIGGLLSLVSVKQEVFPEFQLDLINVTVPYPGASPSEVEQSIVLAIEEGVRGVEGVKRVTSVASEDVGTINIELLIGADGDAVLAEVKNEVDQIQSFPEEAEEPIVSLAKARNEVASLIIAGDQELRTLHDLAELARERLLADERVSQVDLEGVPPLEISIEISREQLEAYSLDLQEVSKIVQEASLELPGGALETTNGDVLLRVADRRRAGFEFRDIVVATTAEGGEVRLGDIATIVDGYEDTKQSTYYNGRPAVRLTAFRVGDETPQSVALAVADVAKELDDEWPDEVTVTTWNDQSELLRDRIDLLSRNAFGGLLLVLVILALFLDIRLALWVSMGIPISFLGSFLLLAPLGFSINMVSLFAFIVTLGMVVDDAIVVGEQTYSNMECGMTAREAAIAAAQSMVVPVTFAILTTAAAFSPLMFVPGVMGKFFRIIPMVVISVLFLSLFESFLILPNHLGHGQKRDATGQPGIIGALARARAAFGRFVAWGTEHLYKPVAQLAVRGRYITLAIGFAIFAFTIAIVQSGWVPFNFFPAVEGDLVQVQVRMPFGTSIESTRRVKDALEIAARGAAEELDDDAVRGMYTYLGQSIPSRGFDSSSAVGSHLTGMEIQLVPSGSREFTSADFAAAWRHHMPEIAGIESINFISSNGPGAGADVAVQLLAVDTGVLEAASREVEDVLRKYPALKNISNEWTAGKPRLDYHMRNDARSLGLSANDLARQLRGSFYGAEAIREQRGRNEIKVQVRLPLEQRESDYDLERFRIQTKDGGTVPLSYVADVDRSVSPTTIRREDGKRNVTVEGTLAEGYASPREVLEDLQENLFPELREKYPSLSIGLVGAQREQREVFQSLGMNAIFALVAIFALLALPFRSYLQPIIIMGVIPFGFVGAVIGHVLLGYELSILSVFGLVALAGVVVNDSLVLIDATNQLREKGKTAYDAIIEGGASRLRPILLTSLTTFFGLVPMMAETSVQARFLIPMAISLGFGVLFATFVVLLGVPAFYMVIEDVVVLARRLIGRGPPEHQELGDPVPPSHVFEPEPPTPGE